MVTSWCYKVMYKKGVSQEVINRYNNIYEDNTSIVVVNNIQGRAIQNTRQSVRQGDDWVPTGYVLEGHALITSLPHTKPVSWQTSMRIHSYTAYNHALLLTTIDAPSSVSRPRDLLVRLAYK